MLFTTLTFAIFFTICFVVHWSLPRQSLRKAWLLACSYVFYGWWDWRFLGLILFTTAVNYVAARGIAGSRGERARRAWLTLSLVVCLGVLGFFKYFGFFTSSAAEVLATLGVEAQPILLEVILPVGISFFTFQALSYTIDVYRHRLEPTRNFFDIALYIGFFPQLVAGPIVRALDFLPQLSATSRFAEVDVRRYLVLFVVGFFKKTCLSDNIATAIDPLFAAPEAFGSADLALATIGYSGQIYCDFSGYTDMAIAVAGLLGYRLMLNFDFPYLSGNIREFWQRWHISLSSWLRDYLYIPLGGSRHGRLRTNRNLMATMLLGGLWHGAAWTFVVWGALHGLALLAHRGWSRLRGEARASGVATRWLAVAATFSWVAICFTIFRCDDLGTAIAFLRGLLGLGTAESHVFGARWPIFYALLGGVHLVTHRRREKLARMAHRVSAPTFSFAYGAFVAVVLFFTPTDATPFIYFQF